MAKVRIWDLYDYALANPSSTEREIASGVGLKKTPYTRNILLWLVANGYLVRTWDEMRTPHAYVFHAQSTVPMNMK